MSGTRRQPQPWSRGHHTETSASHAGCSMSTLRRSTYLWPRAGQVPAVFLSPPVPPTTRSRFGSSDGVYPSISCLLYVVPQPLGVALTVTPDRLFHLSDVPAVRQHPPYGGGEDHVPRPSRGHRAVLQQPRVRRRCRKLWATSSCIFFGGVRVCTSPSRVFVALSPCLASFSFCWCSGAHSDARRQRPPTHLDR